MGAEGLGALGFGLVGLLQGVMEGAGKRMQAERAAQRLQDAHDENILQAELIKAGKKYPSLHNNPAYQAFFDDSTQRRPRGQRQTGATPGESLREFMRLQSTFAQGYESKKETENLEANQQLAQEEVGPNTSRTVGSARLPGGSTTKTGPPVSFGQKIDALLWQRFKKRAADATPAESEWAKEQIFREELKQDIIKNGAIKGAELQQRISPEWFVMLRREQIQKILTEAQTEARPDVMGWRGQVAAGKRINELRAETTPEAQELKNIDETRQMGWRVKEDLEKRKNAFDGELTQLERDEKEYDKERELRWKMRGNLEEQRQQSSPEFIKLEEEREERAVVRALKMEALRHQLQESPEYQAQLDRLNELEAKRKARTAEILRPQEVETARQVKGATVQEELNVGSTKENLEKVGKITRTKEQEAAAGRKLGELDPEVLKRSAEEFAAQEKRKREAELARPLTSQEQQDYGVDASWTLGDVVKQAVQSMHKEDRAAMASITAARDAVARIRYYSSQVNDFGPMTAWVARSDAWLKDLVQAGPPEYKALANLTLEIRSILNAKGEFGKAIAVEDIEQTAGAMAKVGLTANNAQFLIDRLDTVLLEGNQTIIDKYQPRTGPGLEQLRQDTQQGIQRLKGAQQKSFEEKTKLYHYQGYEKYGVFTEGEWQRILKKNSLPFEKGKLLPDIRSEGVTRPTTPASPPPDSAASPPALGGITPETPLYRGGHPDMGGKTLEKWKQLSRESGFDMSKEHFYPTAKEAEENAEAKKKEKAPGPQSKRGWRKGTPVSVRG